MPDSTIQDWLDRLPDHFSAEMAEGVDGEIQLRLSGEQGGNWFITIRDQQIQSAPGISPRPNVTLTGSGEDVLKVLTGKMDGMRAYMMGKLKVSGDMGFAMRLVKLFKT